MVDFSVLIPVYNTKPHHLLEAFWSVTENQSINQKFRVVIVDDGSTDPGTLRMLQHLRSKSQCSVYTMPENVGTSVALNKGHELIESEWIALMGSDDISHRDRFLLQVNHIKRFGNVDVLGTNLATFYDDDILRKHKITTKHREKPRKDGGWQTNHGTVMYKNQVIKDCGGYDPAYKRGQDYDLWKRMLAKGKKFQNIHELLYLWRRYR